MKVTNLVKFHILHTFLELDANGKSRVFIARVLGISIRTLRNYLNEFRKEGYEISKKVNGCTVAKEVDNNFDVTGMATNEERLRHADYMINRTYL